MSHNATTTIFSDKTQEEATCKASAMKQPSTLLHESLNSEIHDSSAHSQQLYVPHDGPAHFKQLYVPTTAKSTGLQAYDDHHSSSNDVTAPQALSASTATKTVIIKTLS